MKWWLAPLALLGAAGPGCGETSTIQNTEGAAGGAVAGNSGASGGPGGGAGGVGGAGTSGRCSEIRLKPMYTSRDEWARVEDGLIKTVGAVNKPNEDNDLFVRELLPSGELARELTFKSPASSTMPLDCAWKGSVFFCASGQTVVLGDTSGPGNVKTLDVIKGWDLAAAAHWDGEAFAVHIIPEKGDDGTLELVRFNAEGEPIQEPTVVTKSFTYFGTNERGRIATDAVSGRTFVIKGSSSPYFWVSAHERDGKPLFPMDTKFDTSPHLNNSYPAMGIYPGGIFVATKGDNTAKDWWPKPHFYRISSSGELDILPDLPLPEGETLPGGGIDLAVFAQSAEHAWVVMQTDTKEITSRLLLIEWKNGAFGPVQVVIDSRDANVPKSILRPLDLRDPVAFEIAGQRWVGFNDLSNKVKRTPRFLRVDDPSCRYAPLTP